MTDNSEDNNEFLMKVVAKRCYDDSEISFDRSVEEEERASGSTVDESSITEGGAATVAKVPCENDNQYSHSPSTTAGMDEEWSHHPPGVAGKDAMPPMNDYHEPGAHAIEGPGLLHNEQAVGIPVVEGAEGIVDVLSTLIQNHGNILPAATVAATIDGAVLVEEENAIDMELGPSSSVFHPSNTARTLREPDSSQEVVEGVLEEKRNSNFFWVVIGLIIVVIAAGVAIPLAIADDGTNMDSNAPNATAFYPPFHDDLPKEVIACIQDTNSACSLANAWMIQDPLMNTYSVERQNQRFYMTAFYHSMGGENWTRNDNWLSYDVSECEWYMRNSSLSIHGWNHGDEPEPVCDKDNRLRVVNLTSNNLQGTLPPELFRGLTNLRTLDLSRNRLTGELPTMAVQPGDSPDAPVVPPLIAASLEYLWIYDNQFLGSLPTTWASLHRLRSLQLQNNHLTGGLPSEINQLTELETLYIQNNALTGSFPYIEGMKALEYLWFFDNQFDQGLPYEFFRLKQLVEIRGHKNRMGGTIPPEIENLRNLRIIQLDNNQIEGHLADVFYENTNLGT